MTRPVIVHRRRRTMVGTRVQVAAAAAVAVAALIGAGQLAQSKSIDLDPTFVPSGSKQIKLPSPRQLENEQAILERAQVGRPVQLRDQVL